MLVELPLRSAELEARAARSVPRLTPETTQIHAPNLDGRRFLGGIVDLTGRLIPAPVSQVVAGRGAGPEELYRTLYFAGFDVELLETLLAGTDAVGIDVPQAEPPTSGASSRRVVTSRNGFVLAPLDALGQVSRAGELM